MVLLLKLWYYGEKAHAQVSSHIVVLRWSDEDEIVGCLLSFLGHFGLSTCS